MSHGWRALYVLYILYRVIQRNLSIKKISAPLSHWGVFLLFIYFYTFNKKRYVQQVQCVQPPYIKPYSCTPLVHTSFQVCTPRNSQPQHNPLQVLSFYYKNLTICSADLAIRSKYPSNSFKSFRTSSLLKAVTLMTHPKNSSSFSNILLITS